jgi:hypothetical protein
VSCLGEIARFLHDLHRKKKKAFHYLKNESQHDILCFSIVLLPQTKKKVAELMVTRCIREAVALAWVVLWVLSTRVGTLLLCGRLCLAGGGFPYVRKFADMPPERREAALQRWNRVRWLFPLRIAFAIVKILCHYVFYAMVLCSLSLPSLLARQRVLSHGRLTAIKI